MMNNKKRKEARMNANVSDAISNEKYNLIIGAMLLYGFVANAILVTIARNFVLNMNPITFLIGYFICAIVGSLMVNMSHNPVISFVGYNFIAVPIGAVLSITIPTYEPKHIIAALLATAIVTAAMMVLGILFKQFFSKLGPVLFISLIVSLVVERIVMLCGYGGDIFNWVFVVIFSLYIGYDWHKAQCYPKTVDNAIDSAVDLYVDIINLFIRLLEIFGKKD